ncbi:3-hydroxyisobutyrate dehydrogenase [Flavobacterium zepuense]|uniref:3-hydroxyisobutyrate dehydrogenase n=1 Tax=Flavobacterium zepuense TaxID=2593302 RepID=A0A552V9I4_9FLAO|nr:NAD(P)-binding domain-containing protein [Flavobacterium zepuense]TRW27125.1 3-hydroxyisobutyrate dehydrogenase [Flavobacterium zepuense]
MKIGIIGTGAIGGTIAKKMVLAGHQVSVSNSGDFKKLEDRADELGASPKMLEDLVRDVEIIIISVPTIAIPSLAKTLFDKVSQETIVVDTSNYYPFRDADIEEIKYGKAESVWLSEQIGCPVIKAFNMLLAETLVSGGKPNGAPTRIAMAISGDDAKAKEIISGLVDEAGFDVVDAGDLESSWRHQPGTPAYCTELNATELKQALKDGDREAAPQIRDSVIKIFMERTSQPSHEETIEINRSLFPKNPKTA